MCIKDYFMSTNFFGLYYLEWFETPLPRTSYLSLKEVMLLCGYATIIFFPIDYILFWAILVSS